MSRERVMEQGSDGMTGGSPAPASKPLVKSQVSVTDTKTKILVVKGNVTEWQANGLIVTIADDLKHSDGAARLVATAGTHLYCTL